MNFKFKYHFVLFTLLFNALFGSNQNIEQVVILGGGPAGCTAAIYTSRAGLGTLMVEGDHPSHMVLPDIIENYPGFPEGIEGYQLHSNMRAQAERFGTKIQCRNVVEVDLASHPFLIKFSEGEPILAQALIVALGSSVKCLGLESEKALTGRGVSICTVCDAFLFSEKEVVVVGNGNMACEEALVLANYASKVTIIPQGNTVKASQRLRDQVYANNKIQFIWNNRVEEIQDPKKQHVTGVMLEELSSGQKRFFPCDGVFVALGYKPNSDLFQGQLELHHDGCIALKPFSTETSVSGVFAAGNITDSTYRQTVTAAGSGCMAGLDAYHFIQKINSKEQDL